MVEADYKTTPFFDMHTASQAKMASFAGYHMPMSYPLGALREHLHCRTEAALFDVSHMGQLEIELSSGKDTASALLALETVIPSNLAQLAEGRQRYGLLLNERGGICDDLMVMHGPGFVRLVVNAATTDKDIRWLSEHLPDYRVKKLDRALLALQGPKAADVLARLLPALTSPDINSPDINSPDINSMGFMQLAVFSFQGDEVVISRSGYTGEDGFEISLNLKHASDFAEQILAQPEVEWAGLIARDSLRMEAGLPLYGQDMDETVSVAEAGLSWAVGTARRRGGVREGGFIGSERTLSDADNAGADNTGGLIVCGVKAGKGPPARAGAPIFADESSEQPIGVITSGGPAPSCGYSVAMVRISSAYAEQPHLFADVRGRKVLLERTEMPFIPHRYYRP